MRIIVQLVTLITNNAFCYLLIRDQHIIFYRVCYICWQFLLMFCWFLFNKYSTASFGKTGSVSIRFYHWQKQWDQSTLDLFWFPSSSLTTCPLSHKEVLTVVCMSIQECPKHSMLTFYVCIGVMISHFNRKFRNL